VLAGAASPALADDPADGDLVVLKASYVFAPVGFDDNDDVSLVIDGYLPSGCYRLMRPEVAVDHDAKTITVTPIARFFNIPCIEALIPYWQEIRLGVLPEGTYQVQVAGDLKESLAVAEATTSGPDDYLYAPIDAAAVDRQIDSNDYVIKLQGRFTNSCMVMSEIRVIDTGKTINVLPIMTMREPQDGEECGPVETEFRRMVSLPTTVVKGRHLLHVRSLNGQAVNAVFTRD
jgi:hypothetical protein